MSSWATVRFRSATPWSGQCPQGASFAKGNVLAGSLAPPPMRFTLFELFDAKLESAAANLTAAVELARTGARTPLQKLEALLAVADREASLLITGNGDVRTGKRFDRHRLRRSLRPGRRQGPARPPTSPRLIVEHALHIAADICVHESNPRLRSCEVVGEAKRETSIVNFGAQQLQACALRSTSCGRSRCAY